MTAVRKYLFDDGFETVAAAPEPASPPRRDHSALRAHEDRLRAEGFAAGRAAALNDAATRSAEAVENIAAQLAGAIVSMDAFVEAVTEDAAELAIAAANHLAGPAAPPAFAAHARVRLAAIIADQVGAPGIAIKVAPPMLPYARAAVDHVVGSAAYAGRVVVAADGALAGCDLVIDWQTGALHELRRDRLDALAGRIAEYFTASAPQGDT